MTGEGTMLTILSYSGIINITQYSSTVYIGIAMALKTIKAPQLNNNKSTKLESLHVEMYHYELENRGIIIPLTLVGHVLLIVISPCNVLMSKNQQPW